MSNWAISFDGDEKPATPPPPAAVELEQRTEQASDGVRYNLELQDQLYEHAPGKLAQGLGIEIEAPDGPSYNTLLHFCLGHGLRYEYVPNAESRMVFRIFPTG